MRRELQRWAAWLAALTTVAAGPMALAQDNVSHYVRIRGQGDVVLQGLGLVVGLAGTGDQGDDLAIARPLAQLLRNLGNPIESFEELEQSRSAALVMVTCVVPRHGAAMNDNLRVRVSVVHSAPSLAGGELLLAPLRGPDPSDENVYAFAAGPVVLDAVELPTSGFINGGARVVRDLRTTPSIGDFFDLVVDPPFVGFSTVSYLAGVIQDDYYLTVDAADVIARPLDERTIRVAVPAVERENVAAFVSAVLQTRVASELMGLPARVVASTRTGVITFDGRVELSPAAITHRDLLITTTLPPPQPTPEAPLVQSDRWTQTATDPDAPQLARLEDLLSTLNRLDVPTLDQIEILKTLHEAGKLHAKLIIDGVEQ